MREKGWAKSGERIVISKWWEGLETEQLTNKPIFIHSQKNENPGTYLFQAH